MSQEMLTRAKAVKERNKLLETVPGSGYHDEDKDHKGRPRCPQKKPNPLGQPGQCFCRVSDNCIPFWDARHVHFVGADAEKVLSALGAWLTRNKTRDLNEMTGTERALLRIIPPLAVANVDSVPRLSIWKDEWNDVLHALTCESVDGARRNNAVIIASLGLGRVGQWQTGQTFLLLVQRK